MIISTCFECDKPCPSDVRHLRDNHTYCDECLDAMDRCVNCKKKLKEGEGHFVPPSLGQRGFFCCTRA